MNWPLQSEVLNSLLPLDFDDLEGTKDQQGQLEINIRAWRTHGTGEDVPKQQDMSFIFC
jgi:hypothetical protein